VPFAVVGDRLLVRARRELAIRIWEGSRVEVMPQGLEATGRVLTPEDEPAAESAFAARDGLLERARLRVLRLFGVDLLYIELAPTSRVDKPASP
jgi:hypothetical protein